MISAKECAIKFAHHPQEKGSEFILELPGDTKFAARYIQRMRVEMARIRKIIKNRGYTLRSFKMIHLSSKYQKEKDVTIVVLQKIWADSIAEKSIEEFASLITGQRLAK